MALAADAAKAVTFAELNPDPIKFMTYGTKAPMTFDHLADRNGPRIGTPDSGQKPV
jgi:hypothetical protein